VRALDEVILDFHSDRGADAGLLLVGAQTGFLDGPEVHSNMASDYWEPRHFRDLSARLVRQNRVIVMGAACLAIMLWTQGEAAVLVVLYSINVHLLPFKCKRRCMNKGL
jgi:hypothetical protein